MIETYHKELAPFLFEEAHDAFLVFYEQVNDFLHAITRIFRHKKMPALEAF